MRFDPVKTRHSFETFALDFLSKEVHDPRRPMGNVASCDIALIVTATLVGLQAEAAPFIPRALDWLDKAIAEDEQLGTSPNHHRMTLHWARALGHWLRDGVHGVAAWDQARRWCDAAAQGGDAWSSGALRTTRLDDAMAFHVLSGQYALGIAQYEKCWNAPRMSLQGIHAPRKIGYAICLHALQGRFDKPVLYAAARRMLSEKLDQEWLGPGQFIRAATWLAVVHALEAPAATPVSTLLKAYDDMPSVQRPAFIAV